MPYGHNVTSIEHSTLDFLSHGFHNSHDISFYVTIRGGPGTLGFFSFSAYIYLYKDVHFYLSVEG